MFWDSPSLQAMVPIKVKTPTRYLREVGEEKLDSSFTLIYLVIQSFFSLLTLSLPPNQMASPNRKREDIANREDLDIPAQTQELRAMAAIMIKTQPHVAEQATCPRNDNPISSENHQVSTTLPPFDKEKLLAVQARVLQGRLQPNISSPHRMVLTKAEIPTGPVKRQVAEAWNFRSNKRSRETPELEMERQYKDSKSPETWQCCEHYGRLCLQKTA